MWPQASPLPSSALPVPRRPAALPHRPSGPDPRAAWFLHLPPIWPHGPMTPLASTVLSPEQTPHLLSPLLLLAAKWCWGSCQSWVHRSVKRAWGSASNCLKFKSQLCCSAAVSPWTSHSVSRSLSYFVCSYGIMRPPSLGAHRSEIIYIEALNKWGLLWLLWVTRMVSSVIWASQSCGHHYTQLYLSSCHLPPAAHRSSHHLSLLSLLSL